MKRSDLTIERVAAMREEIGDAISGRIVLPNGVDPEGDDRKMLDACIDAVFEHLPANICGTPDTCGVRQKLGEQAKHTRLALAQRIGTTALPAVRDAFLTGNDIEALAILTTELGMVQLASRQPTFRALGIGDPVVAITYGRITQVSTGHWHCYKIQLFSEGLGYGSEYAAAQSPRSFWAEADEVRYCEPPSDVLSRVPVDFRKQLDARMMEPAPTRLSRAESALADLTEGERMAVLQTYCTGCGAHANSKNTCDCAKQPQEGTF